MQEMQIAAKLISPVSLLKPEIYLDKVELVPLLQ
jgi:hypothetical protein